MKGMIVSHRRGRHTQNPYQVIIEVKGVTNKNQAAALVGKTVLWTSPGGKTLKGTITAPHGNSGRVRARFSKGVPGQAIGDYVEIN